MSAESEIQLAKLQAELPDNPGAWGIIMQILQRKRNRLKHEHRAISDQERKDTVNAIKKWHTQKQK